MLKLLFLICKLILLLYSRLYAYSGLTVLIKKWNYEKNSSGVLDLNHTVVPKLSVTECPIGYTVCLVDGVYWSRVVVTAARELHNATLQCSSRQRRAAPSPDNPGERPPDHLTAKLEIHVTCTYYYLKTKTNLQSNRYQCITQLDLRLHDF